MLISTSCTGRNSARPGLGPLWQRRSRRCCQLHHQGSVRPLREGEQFAARCARCGLLPTTASPAVSQRLEVGAVGRCSRRTPTAMATSKRPTARWRQWRAPHRSQPVRYRVGFRPWRVWSSSRATHTVSSDGRLRQPYRVHACVDGDQWHDDAGLGDDATERQRVAFDYTYEGGRLVDNAFGGDLRQRSSIEQFTFEDRNPAADRSRLKPLRQRRLGHLGPSLERVRHWRGDAFGHVRRRLLGHTPRRPARRRHAAVRRNFPTRPFPNTDFTLAGFFIQDEISLSTGASRSSRRCATTRLRSKPSEKRSIRSRSRSQIKATCW